MLESIKDGELSKYDTQRLKIQVPNIVMVFSSDAGYGSLETILYSSAKGTQPRVKLIFGCNYTSVTLVLHKYNTSVEYCYVVLHYCYTSVTLVLH